MLGRSVPTMETLHWRLEAKVRMELRNRGSWEPRLSPRSVQAWGSLGALHTENGAAVLKGCLHPEQLRGQVGLTWTGPDFSGRRPQGALTLHVKLTGRNSKLFCL